MEALDGGADDYITKPFGIPELLARVRAALRHARRAEPSVERPSAPFRVYDLVVDYAKRRAFVSGEDARLTPMEYRIVELLSCHAGKVLTHDMLLAYLWGRRRGNNRLLRVNMANIRRKLEKIPRTRNISSQRRAWATAWRSRESEGNWALSTSEMGLRKNVCHSFAAPFLVGLYSPRNQPMSLTTSE